MKPKSLLNKRDPEKTQATILEEATRCFAKAGFHGTALSEILKRAKVNKRMIYHYFGSKKSLYRAVHRKGWEELQTWFTLELSRSASRNLTALDDEALLLDAIRIFHDFISGHQLFLRLLVWDGLEGGAMSRSLWKDLRGPIYRQLEALVLDAQQKGVLPADLKAGHLIISFMGAISFYFSHAHTMVDIFQKNTLSPEAIEERKEQIMALFQRIMGSFG
jgi:AcrR family transcriptional regulator